MFPAFVHYSDASQRKALRLIRGRFGDLGEAVWWRFMEILNQNDGGPIELDRDKKFLIAEYMFPLIPDEGTREKKMIEFFEFCSSYKDEEGIALIDTDLWKEGKLWNEKNLNNVIKKLIKKSPPKPKREIVNNDPTLIFCKQMFSDVRKLFPKLEVDPRKWVYDMDYLIEQHGLEEVRSVWNWMQTSQDKQAEFCRKNWIRSAKKFREKYGELHGFMKQHQPRQYDPFRGVK